MKKLLGRHSNTFSIKLFVLIFLVISFGCVQNDGVRNKRGSSLLKQTGSGGSGNTAIPDVTDSTGSSALTQKVELSHLIDPFDGTYKKKVTIPKNFKGNLYIAGLNFAAVSNRLLKVRLNFGVERQSIVLNTTLARAPGIVPKTDIQVLIVDLTKAPFTNYRLPYDLYDYNDYGADPSLDAVTDPRNGGLYCRGLRLEDDPTYNVVNETSRCSGATDKCLYSYAKIMDSSFYSSNLTSTPVRPQVWSSALSFSQLNGMCLPDYSLAEYNSWKSLHFNSGLPAGYDYQGPYRPVNQNEWHISSNAIFSSVTDSSTHYYGLFETGSSADKSTWYRSLLFPRSGKLSLGSNINYWGSVTPFATKSSMTSDSTGTTKYVGGCNLRALNYDTTMNESMSACNVTATIELFYSVDGKDVSVTTDKAIKLQIIRQSKTNSEGKEVLSSAFKRCESSSTCGTDECCYNSRCWSKELVTQCVDQVPVVGNQEVGANCTSDFECSSLCCNQSTGACAPHNPNGIAPVLCSKSSGQSCVAQEFCAKEYVPNCKVVRTGYRSDGTMTCDLRCPAVETYGTCKSGMCYPPVTPTVPTFNPNDCSNAVDP